jgi:hypothetical protein
MRHELNWLEYIRKLANEEQGTSVGKHRSYDRSPGIIHVPHNREEWLQAGYSAQMTLPFRAGH